MKTIQVYEFQDLSKDIQSIVYNRTLEEVIDYNLEVLNTQLASHVITEEEYFNILGCKKYYAESTSWFIPSCYYKKHEKEVNLFVKKELADSLYTNTGKFIQFKG